MSFGQEWKDGMNNLMMVALNIKNAYGCKIAPHMTWYDGWGSRSVTLPILWIMIIKQASSIISVRIHETQEDFGNKKQPQNIYFAELKKTLQKLIGQDIHHRCPF